MKISKMWIFKQLFFYTVISFLVWAGYMFFIKMVPAPPDLRGVITIFKGIVCVLTVAFIWIAIYDFRCGYRYVENLKIPIKEFDIKEYKNVIIAKYNGMAFSLHKHNRRFIQKDFLSATQYYDRHKKKVGWLLNIPYMRQ